LPQKVQENAKNVPTFNLYAVLYLRFHLKGF